MARAHPSSASRIFAAGAHPKPRWRADIQALRGLSVLLVVAAHARVPGLQGGFVGVDVFFVLSGFLITALIVNEVRDTGSLSLGKFYARRAKRILPAATLVLVATVLASVYLLGVEGAAGILAAAAWTSVFLSNEYFSREGTDYFASELLPSPLQQFWSLAVEEQFYVIWPALFIAAVTLASRTYSVRPQPQQAVRSYARHGKAWLAAAACALVLGSFAWSAWLSWTQPERAYFSGISRAWELALGCSLALVAGRLPKWSTAVSSGMRLGGLALILAAAVLFTSSTPFPGIAALVPVAGALLVIAAGLGRDGEGSVLESGPLVFLGRISFSLYLWHWPFLTLYLWVYGTPPGLLATSALLVGAFAAAWVTTRFVEEPLRSAQFLDGRTAITLVLAGLLTVLPAIAFLSAIPGTSAASAMERPKENLAVVKADKGLSASEVVSSKVQIAALTKPLALTGQTWPPLSQLGDEGPAQSGVCLAAPLTREVQTCSFGASVGRRSAVVFGDSHAAMWAPALDAWGKSNSVSVTLVTKSGCTPADVEVYSKTLEKVFEQCHEWRRNAFAYLQEASPDIVIVAESVRGPVVLDRGQVVEDEEQTTQILADGMERTMSVLSSYTDNLILVGDVPSLGVDLPSCLARNRDDVSACAQPWSFDSFLKRRDLHRQAVEAAGGSFADPLRWFCTGDSCPTLVDGKIVYRDGGGHITPTYAEWLAPALSEELQSLLRDPALLAEKP